jgi:hypothetical protein
MTRQPVDPVGDTGDRQRDCAATRLSRMPRMVFAPGAESLSVQLVQLLRGRIAAGGGWLPFDRFMAAALYEPGLGYYARGNVVFGSMPQSGSDFVTAPEMTPLFGRALARQLLQAMEVAQVDEVFEFGAGSGALAEQLLQTLGDRIGPLFDRRPLGCHAPAPVRSVAPFR